MQGPEPAPAEEGSGDGLLIAPDKFGEPESKKTETKKPKGKGRRRDKGGEDGRDSFRLENCRGHSPQMV